MLKFTTIITSVLLALSCGNNESVDSEIGKIGYIPQNTGGTDAGIGGGTSCAQQEVPLNALPSDILIIQDRSLSMNDDPNNQRCNNGCGPESKWAQVTTAIKTVTAATENAVNWGLFYFGNGTSMCGVNTNPDIIVSSGNASNISASLDSNSPNGATPTSATINNAVNYMKTLTDENQKYLLLATDGEPNCLNESVNNKDIAGTIDAITNAKNAGFPVFVVGIGNLDAATSTLNSMAQAGGMQQDGATSYYAVSDTSSLETTLNKIVGMISSCTISLKNIPSGEWSIAIWANDSSGKTIEINNDNSNGWIYTDNKSSISLVGTACDSLKNGSYSDLQFVYTCSNQQIIPPVQ